MAIKIYACLRCDHEWASKHLGEPSKCPRCQSKGWRTPRPEPRPRAVRPPPKERTLKYPVNNLALGESVFIPWPTLPVGGRDLDASARIDPAVQAWATRHGQVLRGEATHAGLTYTRIR